MERPGEETLIRYFLGQCSPEEEKVVNAYLALKIDQEYVEACLREAFYLQEDEKNPENSREQRDRVWNKLLTRQQEASVIPIKRRKRWYSYAAAVALLFLTGGTIFLLNGRLQNTTAITWTQMRGETGKPKIVTLADNSKVTLFPGSAIDVPSNFNGTDRRVKLNGRAFFQVAHNKLKPFYVTAQALTTRVLGTSFEINSASHDNIITLHTGRISVSNAVKQIAVLTPNQQIDYQPATGTYKVVSVDAASTLSWLRGELNYDRAPLSQVMNDIEKWYGVTIHAENPTLLNQKVVFSFKDQSLSRVLFLLSKSADFNYEINGKHVTLKERSADTN